MAKAYSAAEPAMDDLLASIRRAIDEDIAVRGRAPHVYGTTPSGWQAQNVAPPERMFGTASGRVARSEQRADSNLADDFRQLREKIARELSDLDQLAGRAPAPSSPQLARSSGDFRSNAAGFGEGRVHEAAVRSLQPAPKPYAPQPRVAHPVQPDYLRPLRTEPMPEPQRPERQQRPVVRPGEFARLLDRSYAAAAPVSAPVAAKTQPMPQSPAAIAGLEETAAEILRPMLRQWLDAHLPSIVERLVREEIERVSRRGGR